MAEPQDPYVFTKSAIRTSRLFAQPPGEKERHQPRSLLGAR